MTRYMSGWDGVEPKVWRVAIERPDGVRFFYGPWANRGPAIQCRNRERKNDQGEGSEIYLERATGWEREPS